MLTVLYFNPFLNSDSGEGVVARSFVDAASRFDDWNVVSVPKPMVPGLTNGSEASTQQNNERTVKTNLIPSRIRHHKVFSPLRRYRNTRRHKMELRNGLQMAGKVDVILLATKDTYLEGLAAFCRQTSVPIGLLATAPQAYETAFVFGKPLNQRDRQNENYLYERADAIIVISESMKQLLVDDGVDPLKIFPIPNGVDFDRFEPKSVDASITRRRLDIVDRKVVGYVGGFWKGNDIATLLKAWRIVESAEPEAVLLLVGDGELRPYAQELSRELGLRNCIWTGRVEHPETPQYLSTMDVAVAPYNEPALLYVSPLKVIEYMAMGLPVVAAKGGQIQELIDHGATGYLYKPGSISDLTEGILTFLVSKDSARIAGENARQRIRSNWRSWDDVARDVMSICYGLTT